ncbi:MAG: EAL domain-containing protein [Deltaproteobacteria bacterium]|nr:EAL domain-containing protein [Deltaproteobacteria bacterium]
MNKLSPATKKALKFCAVFALLSVSWILLSDNLLFYIVETGEYSHWGQTIKGFFFLVVVSGFLFLLLRRSFSSNDDALKKVEKSEARFAAFMEHLPAFAFIKDAQSRFLFVNRRYEEGFGSPVEKWIGKTIQEMVPGINDGEMIENDIAVLTTNHPTQFQETVKVFGSDRTFLVSKFPLVFGQGTAIGGICFDISEWEQAKKENQLAQEDLNISYQAIEASSNGIMICDATQPDLPISYVNPAFEKITGYEKDVILGKNPRFLAGNDLAQKGLIKISRALEERKESEAEIRNFRKDGSSFWNELKISPVQNKVGYTTHFVGIINDITQRKRDEEELKHKATHDLLTGLANRSLLEDRINQSIYYATRSQRIVAVLLLDLDRFKRINDTLGHRWGDVLLKEVGRRLSISVRECDTVARFGGDEFVIVLAEVAEMADVGTVTRKIQEKLSRPMKINHHELEIHSSVGICCYPKDAHNPENLIKKADLAMYQAKLAGGNTFRYFSPRMKTEAKEKLNIEAGLREALKNDELILHYQPKVDMQSGSVLGCEALVRWQHPQKGLIPPDHFIPVAEESGLILPLGAWVLKEACRQARTWKNTNLAPGRISINVSAAQFRQENFVQQVADILTETDVDSLMIALELTESMVLENVNTSLRIMAELKDLGLELHLDDFGTGYSNFSSLRKYKVDCLKIDRSFIDDAILDRSAAAIIQSIIAIATNLGIRSVAEGVETREQLDFLAQCGCDEYQGYFFSKPLPADEFTTLIQSFRGKGS